MERVLELLEFPIKVKIMSNLDKNIRLSVVEERLAIVDRVIVILQENIEGNFQSKENGLSLEQQLGNNISVKQALLKVKQSIEDEI